MVERESDTQSAAELSCCYGQQEDKPPLKITLKKDMINWLRRCGVAYDVSTRKANLFAAIEKLKPKDKIFKVDNMLHAHGHTALRTPPYMCDRNPIELAWANIKHYVRSHNMTEDMSLKRLEELLREGLNRVTANNWSGFCQHVVSFENEYWVKDSVMEDATDSFVINLGTSESDDEDSELSKYAHCIKL
jgi:transposase